MKLSIKSPQQIQIMQQGGKKLSKILSILKKETTVGITTLELDKRAEQLIEQAGGQPSFKTISNYYWSTCINLNDSVVHGVPNNTIVSSGDIVSIDIGMVFKGLHTDMSTTFQVGKQHKSTQQFLQAGQTALNKAIKKVKPGNYIGHISKQIQNIIETAGYRCVPELIGHGIGTSLHEYPPVPGVLDTNIKKTPKLETGLTIAIEVIYVAGQPLIKTDQQDNWTIRTQDGKISAVFEKTIAVDSDGYLLLTP